VSDIHFEPYEKFYRIRYRLDGILKEVAQPPLAIKDKMASRIKVISRLDISEKRVPQDGRMKLTLSKSRAIDFRVSTLPTLYGEKIVLRILDAAASSSASRRSATSPTSSRSSWTPSSALTA
jgi:type IV pilus assembly protein PilB